MDLRSGAQLPILQAQPRPQRPPPSPGVMSEVNFDEEQRVADRVLALMSDEDRAANEQRVREHVQAANNLPGSPIAGPEAPLHDIG